MFDFQVGGFLDTLQQFYEDGLLYIVYDNGFVIYGISI